MAAFNNSSTNLVRISPDKHAAVFCDGKSQMMDIGTEMWQCGYEHCWANGSTRCSVHQKVTKIYAGKNDNSSKLGIKNFSTKEKAEEYYLSQLKKHIRSSNGDVVFVDAFIKKLNTVKHLKEYQELDRQIEHIKKLSSNMEKIINSIK